MKGFNPTTYDPASDSSPKAKGDPTNVRLTVAEGHCGCGCGLQTNPKSSFRQGHDARLKGILIRAHIAGVPVQINGGAAESALIVARHLGWSKQITEGKARHEAKAAKRKSAKPSGNGSRRKVKVKVGRWTYDAEVREDYGSTLDVTYTDGKGKQQTRNVPKGALV